MKRILFSILLLMQLGTSNAQDALFSQYNYLPTYLNPALTGCGKANMRFSALYKTQWFNLYQPFRYMAASMEYAVFDDVQRNVVNFGLQANRTSKGYLNNTNISAIVGRSFGTRSTDCGDWFLSLALQAGVGFSNVNPDKFVFIDQLNQNGITGAPSQVDLFNTFNNKSYFDFAFGGVFTKGDMMIGANVQHLNQPNMSFVGKPEDGKLYRKYTGHLSYRKEVGECVIRPTLIAQVQGKSNYFMVGTLIDYSNFPIEFGTWYRNATGLNNNSAFCISVGIKWGELQNPGGERREYTSRAGLASDIDLYRPGLVTTYTSMEAAYQTEFNTNNDIVCPTALSGQCDYRFPWEFF